MECSDKNIPPILGWIISLFLGSRHLIGFLVGLVATNDSLASRRFDEMPSPPSAAIKVLRIASPCRQRAARL